MNCLILGAGLMQKPAILSAKELGWKACVVDADDKAVAIPCADEFKKIDLKDKDGILEYARHLQKAENGGLSCVFTAGTDFSASVSYVCEKLGLKAHSYQAALNASIKTRMRQAFADNGVPSPKFLNFTKEDLENPSKIAEISQKLGLPLVVKPVDNMGARGCRMVRSPAELLPALKVAVECSRSGNAIVEEYMEGPEYSIDALVCDGNFIVTGFAVRHIKYPPYFIEIGHTMPAIFDKAELKEGFENCGTSLPANFEKLSPKEIHDQLISVFALGAKALDLSCGVAKADIKFTKNGPMIGEIAGRLSGGYMSGWTFPYASGLNLTKEALKIAAGLRPDLAMSKAVPVPFVAAESANQAAASKSKLTAPQTGSPAPSQASASANQAAASQTKPAAPQSASAAPIQPFNLFEYPCDQTSAERAWLSIPGLVENIEDIEDCGDNAIKDVLPRATVAIGNPVDFPRNNVQKCGNVISVCGSRTNAIHASQEEVSQIFITLQPNTKETDDYLAGVTLDDEKDFPPPAFANLEPDSLAQINGIIPENKKVSDFIPNPLKTKEFSDKIDWNYNTVAETARKFDILRPIHPALDARQFWKALCRGGLQAAVYVSDSTIEM